MYNSINITSRTHGATVKVLFGIFNICSTIVETIFRSSSSMTDLCQSQSKFYIIVNIDENSEEEESFDWFRFSEVTSCCTTTLFAGGHWVCSFLFSLSLLFSYIYSKTTVLEVTSSTMPHTHVWWRQDYSTRSLVVCKSDHCEYIRCVVMILLSLSLSLWQKVPRCPMINYTYYTSIYYIVCISHLIKYKNDS